MINPKRNNRNLVILIAKYPRAGFVKTRLAKSIGETDAVHLYRWMVERIAAVIQDIPGCSSAVFYFPKGYKRRFQQWLGPGFAFHLQRGNDLGQRLLNAARKTKLLGAIKTVIIGADCPFLKASHIRSAFKYLDTTDLVLGPTHDGGYYLIGFKKPHGFLFNGITWSTDQVLAQTVNKARQHRLVVKLLPRLHDIDTPEDTKYIETLRNP